MADEPEAVDPEEAARALKRELEPKPEPKLEPRRTRFKPAVKQIRPGAPNDPNMEAYNSNWRLAFFVTWFVAGIGLPVFLLSGLFSLSGKTDLEHYSGRGKIRGSIMGLVAAVVTSILVFIGLGIWTEIANRREEAELRIWMEREAARQEAERQRSELAIRESQARIQESRARSEEWRAARDAEAQVEREKRAVVEAEAAVAREKQRLTPSPYFANQHAEQEPTAQIPDPQERERIRLEEQVKAREEKRIIDAQLKAAETRRRAEAEVEKLHALRQEQKALLRRKDELAEELPKAQRAPRAYELQLNSAQDPAFRATLIRKQQEAHEKLRELEQESEQLAFKLAAMERQILEARDRIVVLGGDVPPVGGAPGSAPKVAMILELKDGSLVQAQRAILLNRVWHLKLMDGREQQIVEDEIASTRKP